MSGGVDSRALEFPRRFFGAARKAEEEAPGSPDNLLQAEKSYQQARHMAYLAVIQEAYRNFTVEG